MEEAFTSDSTVGTLTLCKLVIKQMKSIYCYITAVILGNIYVSDKELKAGVVLVSPQSYGRISQSD